jgi:hypothetical protein
MNMKTLYALLAAVCLLAAVPSCSIIAPKSDVTLEATQYMSFREVWEVTHTAYQVYADRKALGKVSAKDAADVDLAWNAFRKGYIIALESASNNVSMWTPENVRRLADDVLVLIAAL